MAKKIQFCIIITLFMCGLLSAQESTTEKKVSFNIHAGYSPMAFFAEDSIGTTFSPAGAELGFTVFFLHKSFGNLGIELGGNWAMTNTSPSQNKLITHIIPIHTNFVYQYHFNERFTINSHVGVGMNMYNLQLQPSNGNPSLLEFSASVGTGTGLQIAIAQGFYSEIGIGYIASFPKRVFIHQLVPNLAFGYRF